MTKRGMDVAISEENHLTQMVKKIYNKTMADKNKEIKLALRRKT